METKEKNKLLSLIDKVENTMSDYDNVVEEGRRKMGEIRKRQLKEFGWEE